MAYDWPQLLSMPKKELRHVSSTELEFKRKRGLLQRHGL